MRQYFLILLFFVSFNSTALSQQYIALLNIDSLKKVLLVAKDTQRINTLNLLSKRILFGEQVEGFLETAGSHSAEALAMSKEKRYGKGLGNALLNQAIISSWKSGDFYQILSSLQTALPLLKQAGDWFSVAGCLGLMGECYHHLGENKNAITFFDSSVHLFQILEDTVTSVWTMINEAHSYSDLGNYPAAYKIFHTSQELTPKKDTLLQCFALCHMAQLFVSANLPEIAIEYMNKIRILYSAIIPEKQKDFYRFLQWGSRIGGEAFLQLKQIDSAFKIAAFLNIPFKDQSPPYNLFYGHLYSAMGQYEEALVYFKKGYGASQQTSYEIGHAMHANGLADAYFNLKDFPKSIYYANEAIRVSKQMQALPEQKMAFGILSSVYARIKNYTKAYHYNQLYKSLNDSLVPEDYKRKLSLIQIKDELEMQKKEAQLLSNQNQISQQQIKIQESSLKRRSLLLYIFMAALLVMILLAILVNRNIKLKRRKAQLQQLMEQVKAHQKLTELEKEKTNLEMQALRAQMNPHFIFNCLSSINRFILISKTDEASDYLTKFSRLIRMALHNSEKSLITLESELEALRLYLDLERLRFKNAFDYSITFINNIDINAVYIPPMLIQPFVENAIWHGLMHKKGNGCLEIQLCAENKTLTCAIIDNGIGRNLAALFNSRSAEKNKSMGVQITAGRLALLNRSKNEAAVFKFEDLFDKEGTGCGTKVVLTMPYKNLTEVVA
jgi:tetratricopeptide (TPR) repeat protein